MPAKVLLSLLVLCVSLAGVAPRLIAQLTTLRSETRIVQIDVIAKDSSGKPVTDLTKEQFRVTDAGRDRKVQIFSIERETPSGTQAVRQAPETQVPGIFSNQLPAPLSGGRTTAVVLDGLNTVFDDFASSKSQVQELAAKLTPGDRMAVYVLYNGIRVIQDYTADREQIVRTLNSYVPPPLAHRPVDRPEPAAPGQVGDSGSGLSDELTNKMPPSERAYSVRRRAEESMAALTAIGKHMAILPGRKTLIWVSGGFSSAQLIDSWDRLDRTMAALNDANVGLYAVDAKPPTYANTRSTESMVRMSEGTGGKAIYGRNDLGAAMAEAVNDSRVTYTLGFYLSDDERDGRFHPLEVAVNRPGLSLRYRLGYYPGGTKPPSEKDRTGSLEEAVLSPLDATAVGFAARVVREAGMLKIGIRPDPGTVELKESGANMTGSIDMMFVLVSSAGASLARVSQGSQLRVTPANRELYERGALELPASIRVAPEAATLQIIVRDLISGRVGSLKIPVSDIH